MFRRKFGSNCSLKPCRLLTYGTFRMGMHENRTQGLSCRKRNFSPIVALQPQQSRLMRTLTLCNESLLPIHIVWRPIVGAVRLPNNRDLEAARKGVSNDSNSILGAFSVLPHDAVLPPKGKSSFSFFADPQLLPHGPEKLPMCSLKGNTQRFSCEFSLQVSLQQL